MMHGPSGVARPSSPCMIDNKCSKHYPKKFVNTMTFDEDGYCNYQHRDHEITIDCNGIHLDNRYVGPYNCKLLLRYQAHINVEYCNQSRYIKYLFKYVNKGNDRVTVAFCKSRPGCKDEISDYNECRYVSPVMVLVGFLGLI